MSGLTIRRVASHFRSFSRSARPCCFAADVRSQRIHAQSHRLSARSRCIAAGAARTPAPGRRGAGPDRCRRVGGKRHRHLSRGPDRALGALRSGATGHGRSLRRGSGAGLELVRVATCPGAGGPAQSRASCLGGLGPAARAIAPGHPECRRPARARGQSRGDSSARQPACAALLRVCAALGSAGVAGVGGATRGTAALSRLRRSGPAWGGLVR